MDITLHIIEEAFDRFISQQYYEPDPELAYQLKILGGTIVTHSLLRTYYNKYEQENWPKVLLYMINGFILHCNREYKINITYNRVKLPFLFTEKPIFKRDLQVIQNFYELFTDYISENSANIILNNGNPVNVYWSIPKYDVDGRKIPSTHVSFVDTACTIRDLYLLIGSTKNDYSDIHEILKSTNFNVTKHCFGIYIKIDS